MSVYEGVYKSLLRGVSQQTPQEREDGQLGAQVNMLSDPVTGLRRRGGVKHERDLTAKSSSYIEVIEVDGKYRTVCVDTTTGTVTLVNDVLVTGSPVSTFTNAYLVTARGKTAIRTTVIRDNLYIVNTDKVPKLVPQTTTVGKDPSKFGYFSVRGSQFGLKFTVSLTYGEFTRAYTITTSNDIAAQATPEYVANSLRSAITVDTAANALFTTTITGTTVSIEVKDKSSVGILDVESLTSSGYMVSSSVSRLSSRSELLGTLPPALDGYTIAVGVTSNSAYYTYSNTTKTWSETGAYSKDVLYQDVPLYIALLETVPALKQMPFAKRLAGDAENNPTPSFFDYGITGISAYQSRLVILSGAYVCMSKTSDFTQFMRTTVTELLDDDAIEISSAALNAAQFEYAVPYNRDLVLISQQHQAVIPANSTVLSPKTAVIYPSTALDISLAVKPVLAGRTMYYTYQRGADYYQVGEFIPNTYSESQYYAQNLTDHLPLYAQGICTSMTASTTSNMVVCCSDSKEVLVNQYLWVGEERPLMAFHKWVFPLNVVHAHFIREYLVLFMATATGITVGTLNVQLNQLDDKPVPYLDLHRFLTVVNGEATTPPDVTALGSNMVSTIYDSRTARHSEVMYTLEGNKFKCPYNGVVAVGLRYNSNFTLTPPFLKDENGKVLAGARTTLQQLRMTFKSTGYFNVSVKDTMGIAYEGTDDTAYTWSEADLGYTWVNSIGSVTIPCRTRLSSTECSVQTTGTTDMNLVSTEYVLRTATKRRRL